ncbi:MAG: hypothetical protein IJP58_04270, partial [Clostridia bacterium]|nr:hypothetical protein [Clostridia bacterium]
YTPPETSSSSSSGSHVSSNDDQSSKTVYITPSGKRYHYSKRCAGKNAIATTKSDALASGRDACKKCAY